MAKYIITYKCGHQEEMQLFGPLKDRESKIAWYATIDCPDCRAKKAREEDEKNGLAELEGSPKQISWASEIRSIFMTIKSQIDAKFAKLDNAPEEAKALVAKLSEIAGRKESKYWIDNRLDLNDARELISNYRNL